MGDLLPAFPGRPALLAGVAVPFTRLGRGDSEPRRDQHPATEHPQEDKVRTLTLFQPFGDRMPLVGIADDPVLWLPEESRRAGPTSWNVPLRLGGVTRVVEMAIEDPFTIRTSEWREILWRPRSERGDLIPIEHMLPTFAGEIGTTSQEGHVSLVLNGEYDVPLGFVGAAIDAALLNRAARTSGTRLLGEIAQRMRAATAIEVPVAN